MDPISNIENMVWSAASNPDQAFVILKHGILGLLPEGARPMASILLSIAPILAVFPLLFAITTWLERKGLGRIQNRYGPNRVGPYGLLQPIADGIKMLIKEDIIPRTADHVVHFLAPIALLVPTLLAYSVLPIGRNMSPIDVDAGLLFFFAVGASTELSIFMAGWSSRNKYSLLGAMRAVAQMVSYELPLIISTVSVVMLVGSMSLPAIVDAQQGWHFGWLPRWFVFTPWGFAGFLLFMTAATAEANRSPFDIPEAESEIIAGHLTEYSGFKYAIFFMAEYLGLFAMSGLGITLFLGGWGAPLRFLEVVPSWLWFMGKLLVMICVFIWVRGTVPRLRVDQLMNFAWKFMLPLALINIFVAGIWHFTAGWHFFGAGLVRWGFCAILLAVPYVLLGQGLNEARQYAKRTYRYAD
jgi:NADH-quinone oxidoreductase subunit H